MHSARARLAAKKAGANEEWWGAGPDTLARSKRLILAAIKVWELKQQRISATGARFH